ncbi:MAG: hypothetical protein ABIR19_05330 [Ginsengibacter sp.]
MIKNLLKISLFISVTITACHPSKNTTLTSSSQLYASNLQPIGRYRIAGGRQLELISSAVHFGFNFQGKTCTIFASAPEGTHNYFQYTLDGEYQKNVMVEGRGIQPFVLSAAEGGEHTIWIYKTTEAQTGPLFIQKTEGQNLQMLKAPAPPVIEFIVNSVTCGAAADSSDTPCGQGDYHYHHNAYYAYGPRVARALGIEFLMSSVSCIRVYRNWNSDGPAMPVVYEKTGLREDDAGIWNFKKYSPKVVRIALGTNDFSRGDGRSARLPFDSTNFVSSYIHLVELVKNKYPAAQMALLSSPMVQGANRDILQNCITAVKASIDGNHPSDKPVAEFFFSPMQAHGCSGHPSVHEHAILAKKLLPFYQKLIQ